MTYERVRVDSKPFHPLWRSQIITQDDTNWLGKTNRGGQRHLIKMILHMFIPQRTLHQLSIRVRRDTSLIHCKVLVRVFRRRVQNVFIGSKIPKSTSTSINVYNFLVYIKWRIRSLGQFPHNLYYYGNRILIYVQLCTVVEIIVKIRLSNLQYFA